ncbi:hypothetical protein [Treponema zioleckii]|nr:hypothetical protein [Treponema zioleckii]
MSSLRQRWESFKETLKIIAFGLGCIAGAGFVIYTIFFEGK